MSGELLHRFGVPMLMATYDSSNGEFAIKGMASISPLNKLMSLSEFHLDRNFDSEGLFNKEQKGSFQIKHGSAVLLKGTITEATGSIFAKQGVLHLRSRGKDVEGEWAPMFRNSGGLQINLASCMNNLQENGFALWSVDQIGLQAAEIGQAVPEPSSFAAMASVFLLGLSTFTRRRRLVAKA